MERQDAQQFSIDSHLSVKSARRARSTKSYYTATSPP